MMNNFHRQVLLFVIFRFSCLLLVPSVNSSGCWSFSFSSYFGGGRRKRNRHHDGRHHHQLSSSEEDRAGSKDYEEDGEIRSNHSNNIKINPPQFLYNAEVVGGFGRMGSFWLCHHNDNDNDDIYSDREKKAVAVIPRGISPGYLSPLGCPIYIATPSKSWIHTFEQIPINRRSDCVFVGNGIPSNQFINTTIVVPHYGILQVCRRMKRRRQHNTNDDDDDDDRNDTTTTNSNQQQQQQPATVVVTTSSISPKTFIYGKHAIHTAKVLQRHGVSTQIIDNFHNIQALAGQKLLWASCLWLVCHHHHHHDDNTTTTITGTNNNDDPSTATTPPLPLTVSQAHEYHQDMLDRLLEDLLPALEILVKQKLDFHSVMGYMKSYSQSIPDAIPSKALALSELEERNGVWLKLTTKDNPQLFHQELLRQVITTSKEDDDDDLFNLQKTIQQQRVSRSSAEEEEETEEEKKVQLDLKHIHLTAWGKQRRRHDDDDDDNDTKPFSKPKHISIVGGGIIGSAMALFLGQRLHPDGKIVVFDNNYVQTSSSAHGGGKNEDDDSSSSVGKTTPASWAWINANSKSPKSYQILNLLGIHAWKHERNLSNLPSWMGSLVRFEDYPDFVNDGGLPVEGPLSNDRILELEPYCNWKLNSGNDDDDNNNNDNSPPADATEEEEEGYTFHFPDEACVDPTAAVQALRKAAKKLGNVQFVNNRNVTNIIRDHQTGKISGIMTSRIINGDNEEEKEEEFIETDLVISAAGTGTSVPFLGGIPLLHRPGQIAYAYPTSSSSPSSSKEEEETTRRRLSKILVDPLRSSHLLQRPDGSLVAGGGALEVGGSSGTVKVVRGSSSSESSTLLDGAMKLSPTIVGSATLSHTSSAVRPMPADGLPVVGYVDQGLYVIVTHSGITLGPILASLAAGEILENINCDLLQDYRPSRLLNQKQQ